MVLKVWLQISVPFCFVFLSANLLRRLLVNHHLMCEDFYDYVRNNYYTKQTHYQQSARTNLVLAAKQTLKSKVYFQYFG